MISKLTNYTPNSKTPAAPDQTQNQSNHSPQKNRLQKEFQNKEPQLPNLKNSKSRKTEAVPKPDFENLQNPDPEMNLADIHRFIDMRKDLLEADFSFKLTQRADAVSYLKQNHDSGENVFQKVIGESIASGRPESDDIMLRTEDYRLTLTQPHGQ